MYNNSLSFSVWASDKLTEPIVNELIDSIYVHRDKAITINFKFTDAYMDMLDYIEELKRRLQEEIDIQKPIGKADVILSAVFCYRKNMMIAIKMTMAIAAAIASGFNLLVLSF